MIETFKDFLADYRAWDMYITGRAGTGKTTDLSYLVDYCADNDIECMVAAYTHKACDVLATKLRKGTNIVTLHKFLCKRPTINDNATNMAHISSNCKTGASAKTSILFIDEYSMVGEQDLMDLRAEQDPDYDGVPNLKLVWLGDPYQLGPIGDKQSVKPSGKYCILLTEIKRQAKDNPLGDTLESLVSFIEGAPIEPLPANKNFVRGKDLAKEYTPGDVILCYTNERVQELNAQIQGRELPVEGDVLFSPTTKQSYNFVQWTEFPTQIELPFGEPLVINSKYKTLEYLIQNDTKFAILETEEGDETVMAVEFGHYNHKLRLEELKRTAAASNRAIEDNFPGFKATGWAKSNATHPLARKRAKAWRDFLSYNESVVCLDFSHAMTVHKSQGSTYPRVLVDTDDLHKAAYFSLQQYLKLMYVAISRASEKVITC
jgi:hypothetical protein